MDLIAIGRIVKPIGILGAVKILPLTTELARFDRVRDVWIGTESGSAQRYEVSGIERGTNHIVAQIAGFDTIAAAECLRKAFVFVSGDQKIVPPQGEYLIDDILGCEVVTEDSQEIGKVEDVLILPTNDLWVVRWNEKETLVPAVKAIIRKVDVRQKRIVIAKMEGLFE